MDIEKAKKELKTRIDHYRQFLNSQIWVETDIEAVKVLLNELDKKDKIINEMAEQLAGYAIFDVDIEEPTILGDKQEVIDCFTKKVEGK